DLGRAVRGVTSEIPHPDRLMIELRPATPATMPSLLATHSQQRLETKSEAPGVQKMQPQLVESPRAVTGATQRGIATARRQEGQLAAQDSITLMQFLAAKLSLVPDPHRVQGDRKSSRMQSSHMWFTYALCLW